MTVVARKLGIILICTDYEHSTKMIVSNYAVAPSCFLDLTSFCNLLAKKARAAMPAPTRGRLFPKRRAISETA